MTYGLVSVRGWPLNMVKIIKKDKHRTTTAWPRPLNRGGRLIQRSCERKIGTLKTGCLITGGGRLIQGPYVHVRLQLKVPKWTLRF